MLDKISSWGRKFKKLNPEMQKILSNIGLIFAERILTMAIAFATGILVIRYLGSERFGLLSYCNSFVALFGSISTLGLRGIVVRDIVREESATPEIMGTVLLLRLIGAVMGMMAISLAIFRLESEPQIRWLTIIISSQLIFIALDNTLELWFESQVLSGKAGIVKISQVVFTSITRLTLIWQKLPLVAFALTFIATAIFRAGGMVWLYLRQGHSPQHWRLNWVRGRKMLADSYPLILTTVAIALYMRIDQVMLGKMAGSKAVGIYAAAVKFSEVWNFIPLVICSSAFPAIIRAKQISRQNYERKLQQLLDVVCWLAILLAILMSLIATPAISTILGSEYIAAGAVLRLHIWSGLFVFASVATYKWLLEENMTLFSSITTLCGAGTNILLNLWLIPASGARGAAIATLISYGVSSYLCYVLYPPTTKTMGWMLTKALLVPFRWRQNLVYLRQIKSILFKRTSTDEKR
ncbi:MAG: flippase [Cyanobacteria bacterium J06623_7]